MGVVTGRRSTLEPLYWSAIPSLYSVSLTYENIPCPVSILNPTFVGSLWTALQISTLKPSTSRTSPGLNVETWAGLLR